jgi:hypothetical protein
MESMKNANMTVVAIAALVYNFMIIAGAAYLCAVYNWSLWTILGAFLCMVSIKDDE